MTSEIGIAIGGEKAQLEKLITSIENLGKNNNGFFAPQETAFFSKFKLLEVEPDFWVFAYYSDNFHFDWEKQGIWGVMASQANKMGLSYELCQVNEDGTTRQKNNLHILMDDFDQRLNEVVNLQKGYNVEFKFNANFK